MSIITEFRALDRRVWYLAVARLVMFFGFFMVVPFLGVYLTTSDPKRPAVVWPNTLSAIALLRLVRSQTEKLPRRH